MTTNQKHNLDYVDAITASDASALKRAFQSYGDSWKKRGGVGAFMMLARKWDRLENRLTNPPQVVDDYDDPADHANGMRQSHPAFITYDIFNAIASDDRPEGIINDIRDLRRYLVLVEAEMMVEEMVPEEEEKDQIVVLGVDQASTDEDKTIEFPIPDAKSENFILGESLQRGAGIASMADGPEETYTRKLSDNEYTTILSAADTKKVLRGEPSDNFTQEFITAALSGFMGRQVIGWSEADDRLLVGHH